MNNYKLKDEQARIKEKQISKSLYRLSRLLQYKDINDAHGVARCLINKKYGKGWREALHMNMIYDSAPMSYY